MIKEVPTELKYAIHCKEVLKLSVAILIGAVSASDNALKFTVIISD